MTIEGTKVLSADRAGFVAAANIWKKGGLVAFPTETVYGLGADATNDKAVARIYAAKGRPSFNPLIVHVPSREVAEHFVEFDDVAGVLAQAFWPGALTLVLPLKSDAKISKLVTAGLPTLAIRVPDHPIAQDLLSAFGGPVAAPSANPSGLISPTKPEHVLAGLSGKIDAVVDGGGCSVGLESTIVGCGGNPALLRPGGLPAEIIEKAIGRPLLHPGDSSTPNAPGQLLSHYAPKGTVRLNAEKARPGEFLLGYGAVDAELNLSPSGDLTDAAANLFECLHKLDEMGVDHIAVSPIPERGLGVAINDRLRRAAAPRS